MFHYRVETVCLICALSTVKTLTELVSDDVFETSDRGWRPKLTLQKPSRETVLHGWQHTLSRHKGSITTNRNNNYNNKFYFMFLITGLNSSAADSNFTF